jgi:transketolase
LCGEAIQIIAKNSNSFIGGSADLEPSTKTLIKNGGDVQKDNLLGRNLRFGVREHAMGSIANGLAYDGSWIPYTATFLVFSDYMRPAIRLAALAKLQVLFLFSHDSFYVGEDGPTHQPIEHIASLRLIPNLQVFRPADGLEVALCFQAALKAIDAPSVLLFTRQNLAVLERDSSFDYDAASANGAYIVSGRECEDLVFVATGSEVSLACEAVELLKQDGVSVRVVSMPCQELFMKLSEEERSQIIPRNARKVSIEAGVSSGWEKIVGSDGLLIGIDHFGASAPAHLLAEKYGFVAAAVRDKVLRWLAA